MSFVGGVFVFVLFCKLFIADFFCILHKINLADSVIISASMLQEDIKIPFAKTPIEIY